MKSNPRDESPAAGPVQEVDPSLRVAGRGGPAGPARPARRFALFALILGICYAQPLFELVRQAVSASLYSHVVLIPAISAYLVWTQRRRLPKGVSGSPRAACFPLLAGAVMVATNSALRLRGWQPAGDDSLCLLMVSFLSFLTGGLLWFLGAKMLRAVAFPFAFLIFIVPLPTVALHAIEVFFQHTSAEAANLFLLLSGMTYDREGQVFRLPGITLQVAEECSGIRSSLVLFITSLLAGHLFLKAPWRKAALTLLVIPLGIVRNGFRIFVISLLCVQVSPDMINSAIHRQGGPLFFALSLVPFFLVSLWLRNSERRRGGSGVPESEG